VKLAFIGGGNMAEAMLSAVLEKGLSTPETISVSDIKESRLQYIVQKYSVTVMESNRLALEKGDIVILAVKPQDLAGVMIELNGYFKSSQLVLSIIAGARISTMRRGLNHIRVVRVMPNTPAQIGQGMSIWTATPEVTELQKREVTSLLGAMGKEIYVTDEQYIDMATAVSGSGPAYVFLFIESLVDAAVHIGLPRDIAQELVLQTVLGSALFIQQSGKTPNELRRMVTSPGGTTAEAIARFEEGRFSELVMQAVTAAFDKARILGE
jgi:pyrroline-5-carboxylate reductase